MGDLAWKRQGSPEWHALRAICVGSSDSSVVMGENPYKSLYTLWLEKKGLKEVKENAAMAHGKAMESAAREWYEEQIGELMFPDVLIHPDNPNIIASLDGINYTKNRITEFKCPYNKKNHDLAVQGKIPPHYVAQLQHHTMVTGLRKVDSVSFFEGEGVVIPITRDQSYIERLYDKECEFLELLKLDEFPGAPEQEVSNEVIDLIAKLKDAKALLDVAKDIHDKIRGELISVAGVPFKAHGCSLIKSKVKGSVDYKSIPELQNVDLEQYRKEGREQWTVKWEK